MTQVLFVDRCATYFFMENVFMEIFRMYVQQIKDEIS